MITLSKSGFCSAWVLFLLLYVPLSAQEAFVDLFENPERWSVVASDQVALEISSAEGRSGAALEVDIHFKAGSGYGGIQTHLPETLPDNFRFTFYLKGDLPVNNLEFKLLNKSGDDVWWYNQRAFSFPSGWQKIVIKKRDIEFAWGPSSDHELHDIDKIEIVVASVNGGKGSLYLDDFRFEHLNPTVENPPIPFLSASSDTQMEAPPAGAMDGNLNTFWFGAARDDHVDFLIDCRTYRELGGLIIDWDSLDFSHRYDVMVSNDQKEWEPAYRVVSGVGSRRYINLRNHDARYIMLNLQKSSRGNGYRIRELTIREYEFTKTPEEFFRNIAGDYPRGYFPRYFLNEQSYWTITGPPDDDHEALISEDGCIETNRRGFTMEPFVFMDGRLFTWNEAKTEVSLEKGYLPVPSVTCSFKGLELTIRVCAEKDNEGSRLFAIYELVNRDAQLVQGNFYVALRPFQVNPPWQFLNNPGGTSEIKSIQKTDRKIRINGKHTITLLTSPVSFGAAEFDSGDITEFLARNVLPPDSVVEDHTGFASGALKYPFELQPGSSKKVVLNIPWKQAGNGETDLIEEQVDEKLGTVMAWWENRICRVDIQLPSGSERLLNTIRSSLAYILINRDGAGIQPGSRSYERSWIRDGSLTSSALLKMGITDEPRRFIEWYATHQYENGKVPCVVDKRGPDPVPENDSNGELIFAILQYYLFTKDIAFLERNFDYVCKAVDYMEYLSALRRTSVYEKGDPIQRACYGLLPESISHEGYSAKPMHSYWDDFFALKGYKDAMEIARILGRDELVRDWTSYSNRFATDLYRSLNASIAYHGIDFIPGCVELGDFDATSTAIAIYPCNELGNLPQQQAANTFNRYFEFFENRRKDQLDWKGYTPYEVRLIGSFIYMGQIERAHALIDFFMKDQRPAGWNHWAEVVRHGYRTPGFIGDIPHTWVASDFINAIRTMFVYEDEEDKSLVIGAGLYDDWINNPEGMSVNGMPTYFGLLNYSIRPVEGGYLIEISGNITVPPDGIRIRNFRRLMPGEVIINGRKSTVMAADWITIHSLPATVTIRY